MSGYGLMSGGERRPSSLMDDQVGYGAWWRGGTSKKPRDPYADIPTLHYDIQTDFRGDPASNVNALMERWRQSMREATSNPDAGRVPQFAAPSAMAPPMNRQSSNVEEPTNLDHATMEMMQKVWLPIRALIGASQQFGNFTGMTPRVSMKEISGLLPKQDIPFMGPPL